MNPRREFEIRIAGRKVALGKRTLIMGVLNVTPDSFSDGGRFLPPARAIAQGVKLVRQGADWIDVGGESTRPGSQPVSADEELHRVLPVIRGLRRRLPDIPISIDTSKAEVAEQACEAGADILNDVSGLRFDSRLAQVARQRGTPLILMHMRGRPATMQQGPFARHIWAAISRDLKISLSKALAARVPRTQLILDPGLGFGKTRRQNYEILANLEPLQQFHLPILMGGSRKSFLQAIVAGEGLDPARSRRAPEANPRGNLLMGDAAAVIVAILGGAHIVRVHDPAEIVSAVRVADATLAALG
jgi:dihydropteroate synthase